MPKTKLDAACAQLAECPAGKRKVDYWDTVTTGFVLEVRSTGGKTYYLRYFDGGGRQRQIKIGGHADVTFDQARKAARRLRSEVVLGGDPLAQKQGKRAVPTYATLAEQHIDHAKTYQKSWWSTEGLLKKHVVPRFGRMRLDEITSRDVARFLADKAAEGLSPASCEKLRMLLGRSYQLAVEWEFAGAERNPARGVRIPTFDNRRQRYLTAAETDRLLRAAGRSAQPQLKRSSSCCC
jgi:hypothetical protein